MQTSLVAAILVVLCAHWSAIAQTPSYQLVSPSGEVSTVGSPTDPDSARSWIVLFYDDVPGKDTNAGRFATDLQSALSQHYGAVKVVEPEIHLLSIINGAVFTAPSRVIPALLRLPYVKSFDYNHKVQITPVQRSPLELGAVSSSKSTHSAFTGRGVVIAIIDTGVDYTHPDLGGCLGYQCRVIGGYDVVDGDHDPFDEHGHGTHVAGIAAGNGLSSGVAQDARILAYRALDENGTGTAAGVIEAIERAIIDGAHIINLSLGDPAGLPESPQNLAVREAVRRGVLVVVAAGNNGPQWASIGSPGNEESAVTVGALRPDDELASFSSRGPVRSSYSLKPDISAPGVGIRSAMLGGGHLRLSGTSMATPYVAGVAATLLEMMPEADLLRVRSRLIQSAVPLRAPVWQVGLGKANRDLNQYSRMAAHPISISAKISGQPLHGDILTVNVPITIWSFRDTETTVRLAHDLPAGVTALIPSSFHLPAQGSIDIPASIQIRPDQVMYPTESPPIHLGSIRLATDFDTLMIPVSIAKPSELHLEFQSPPSLVVIHDRKGNYEVKGAHDRLVDLQVGAGVYDVWALRDADATKWVIEGVVVEGSTTMRVLETDARNTLRFELSDPYGGFVGACGYSREFIKHNPTGLGLLYQYQRSCPENSDLVIQTQISDLSSDMRYEVSHIAYGAATQYEYLRFPFRIDGGLNGNRLLRAGGDDFRALNWKYHIPSGIENASIMRRYESPGGNSYTPPSWLKSTMQSPFERREHVIPNPSVEYVPFRGQYDALFAQEGDVFDPDTDATIMLTPSVSMARDDSIYLRLPEIGVKRNWTIPYQGEPLVVGIGPDSWLSGSMAFNETDVRIPTSNTWFAGWNREIRTGTVLMEILGPNGEMIERRHVKNGIPNDRSIHPDHWITVAVGNGDHRLQLRREDTWHGTRRQITTASVMLNSTSVSEAQDCIDRLVILDSQGQPIQTATWPSGVRVVIESTGCSYEPEVVLTHWSSQSLFQPEAVITTQGSSQRREYLLPDALPAGHFDMQIRLGGNSQPVFEHRASPALAITHAKPLPNPPEAPTLVSPESRQFVFDAHVELRWTAAEEIDGYRVQLSHDGDFARPLIDSLVTSSSVRLPITGYGVIWYWRVSARNSEGWGPWATRRSFTTVIEPTSLTDEIVPHTWYLGPNYPNPFNPSTTIQFGIGSTEVVRLDIYSLTGQLVKSVELGLRSPGTHSVTVNLDRLASGLYLYQLSTPSVWLTRKMTLIK